MIHGVEIKKLKTIIDSRGDLTELFRNEFLPSFHFKQLNFVRSQQGVLRGVHVHRRHSDYLIILEGLATIGFSDLRQNSPTFGDGFSVSVNGSEITSILIPPGVAHGFYYHEPTLHLYQVDEYWDPDDELGCFWSDPGLNIQWPAAEVLLSERDATLPTLKQLLSEFSFPSA